MRGWDCGPGREWLGETEQVRRQRGRPGPWAGGWGGAWGGPWGDLRGPAGPPPWVAHLLGGHPGGGAGRRSGRGPRVRRGDVRAAILDVLGEQGQLNGYQIIQQIAERSRGAWKPSPGSVYPTIAQLEDEGLVETVADGGRKVLRLTAEGSAYVADHPDELAALWEPFDQEHEEAKAGGFPAVLGQVLGAVWQILTTGSPAQQQRAAEILDDTRRLLYGVLADGPDDVADDEADDEAEEE
ncbi:MAG TPA: PadR family transcriptional regulator [Marmoricola sp.]|nr:PadR family transcriptional regulator [Marmoricola sp.]